MMDVENKSQPVAASIPLRDWLSVMVPNVFETMIARKPEPGGEPDRAEIYSRVSGSVGLAGPRVTGGVYLHFSEVFAREATAAMLGMTTAELDGDGEVNDVIGEICNMIGGGLKSALCDHGTPCAMSTPAIIRGQAFAIEALPGTLVQQFPFECGGHCFVVEVHLKTE